MTARKETLDKVHHLLTTDPKLLTAREQQRRYVAQCYSVEQPCPYCDESFDVWEAAGWDWDWNSPDPKKYYCPYCLERIMLDVPFVQMGSPYRWGKYLDKYPGAPDRKPLRED